MPAEADKAIQDMTHEEVLGVFAANMQRMRAVVSTVVTSLDDADCTCKQGLGGQQPSFDLP